LAVKAIAPGKLILSGEHAVVHGMPALAMAINRYSETVVTPQKNGKVIFNAANLRTHDSLTLQALRHLKHRLQRNYENFLQGRLAIREVLKKPIELTQFAITHLLESLQEKYYDGFQINTQSTIPIGCGLGSSSATILSVLYAFGSYLNLNWKPQNYYQQALAIENLQHGRSSGLDLNVSQQGGMLWFENNQYQSKNMPNIKWYIVNSGQPLSSTGECVSHTYKKLSKHPGLLKDFAAVTIALSHAIEANNFSEIKTAIKINHQLLCEINVVPRKIKTFIEALEKNQAAAKICGAGTLVGQKAGVVLIISKQDPTAVCEQFGYSCMHIQGESHGMRIL